MSLNKYNIEKWYKMLTGKSVLHVNQDIGKSFSSTEVKGYYNNLMEKVTKEPQLVYNDQLPTTKQPGNTVIVFPVAVFQYGLGCYDLYLETGDQNYLRKFKQLADWTLDSQDSEGRWANFEYAFPDHPFGAMAQGEAASVLIRAYVETKEEKYLKAAQKGLDFMLLPHEKGGTTLYEDGYTIFMEYTHLPVVLNGWIFAWWGLYDFVTITSDTGKYKEVMDSSCKSLIALLPKFRTCYWSKYDLDYRIASPFYHNLHVAQMSAMYQLTKLDTFKVYADTWKKQQGCSWNKCLAFVIKAYQKIIE